MKSFQSFTKYIVSQVWAQQQQSPPEEFAHSKTPADPKRKRHAEEMAASTKTKRTKRTAEMTPRTRERHMTNKKRYPGVKQPRSAYLMFLKTTMQERREADPNNEVFATLVSREWKNLKDQSRYHKMAEEDKERFKRDVEAKGYTLHVKKPIYKTKVYPYRLYIAAHQVQYRADHDVNYLQAHNALSAQFAKLPEDDEEKLKFIAEAEKINEERRQMRIAAEEAEKAAEDAEADGVKDMTE